MSNAKTPLVRKLLLFAYILLLFVSATTRDFGLTPLVARSFGPIAAAFVEPLWKLLFWIAPALFYIARFKTHYVLGYLKLGTGTMKRGILWGLLGSSLFFLRMVLNFLTSHHLYQLSFDDWLNSFVLVGLIEEIVFRGFLFQEIKTWFKEPEPLQVEHIALLPGEERNTKEDEEEDILAPWIPTKGTLWASILSTFLFICIHFPSWILLHQPLILMLATSLFNLIFGFALCFVLTRSRSLWSCILIHSMNDLSLLIV